MSRSGTAITSLRQIDVPESISIEGAVLLRRDGTFRDMVVTHLLQVLAFVAMEQPISLDAKPLRDEISKSLIRPRH